MPNLTSAPLAALLLAPDAPCMTLGQRRAVANRVFDAGNAAIGFPTSLVPYLFTESFLCWARNFSLRGLLGVLRDSRVELIERQEEALVELHGAEALLAEDVFPVLLKTQNARGLLRFVTPVMIRNNTITLEDIVDSGDEVSHIS